MIPILLNNTDERIGFLAEALTCKVTEERNGEFELELQYPKNGRYFTEIVNDRYIKARPNHTAQNQLFRIYEVGKVIDGIVTVKAEHISYALSGYPVKSLTLQNSTALVTVNALLSQADTLLTKGCMFSVKSCDISTTSDFSAANCSVRAALGGTDGSVLDTYGGEFEFDNYEISLHKSRGTDNGVQIRYGKNMTDMQMTVSTETSYTAIMPYAIDNDTVITLPEVTVQVENNANIAERVLIFDFSSYFGTDEAKTADNLRTHVKKYLSDNDINSPTASLIVSMIDSSEVLGNKKAELEKVSLCDTVKVICTDMGISVKTKVIKTVFDTLSERYISLELGTPVSGMEETIKQLTKSSVDIRKALNKNISKLAKQFTSELDEATKAITGASGGHVVLNPPENPQELLILCDGDALEEAERVWRFNSAGLAFSKSGYNGPFSMSLLGDDGKLIINSVTARSISAELIKVGVITSADGYTIFDLDNSVLTSSDADGTKTVLNSGYIKFYYKGKYSGSLSQSTSGELYIADASLFVDEGIYTGNNLNNRFAGLTHLRYADYAGNGDNQKYSAYAKVGVGVFSGTPTAALELLTFGKQEDSVAARLDIQQRYYETSVNGNSVSAKTYADMDIICSYRYNGALQRRIIRLTNNGYQFPSGNIYVDDVLFKITWNESSGHAKSFLSLKTLAERVSALESKIS